uniref:Uncharacterized protein n=1 Tax=Lepeophtheirus salmonis TaxID=72036 RepID=A0A0K2T1M6_LEPSM
MIIYNIELDCWLTEVFHALIFGWQTLQAFFSLSAKRNIPVNSDLGYEVAKVSWTISS